MNKLQKIVFLILLFVLPLFVFSQKSALQILNHKEIDVLNEQLQKSLKKCKCYSRKDSIQLFTFFTLFLKDTISKEEFINGSFLQNLKHDYWHYYKNHPNIAWSNFHKKDSIIYAFHFISSGEKYIAGFAEYTRRVNSRFIVPNQSRRFICNPKRYVNKRYVAEELLKYIWDKENLFIFKIKEYEYPYCPYFIVTEQLEINVFYKKDINNYEIVPIKEFMDRNWDEFSKHKGAKLVGGD
jgi:hypothetical protein